MIRYCDFSCEHASFPPADMLGACRTMSGVYCNLLKTVVPKHVPCRAEPDLEKSDNGSSEGKK